MCGRATITDLGELTPDRFSFTSRSNSYDLFRPRYNLSPRQDIPVVHVDPGSGATTLRPMHWNLIPAHLRTAADVARFGETYSTFNAKVERAATAPTFRRAWTRQRCLVVVDGIIEWVGAKGAKVPYRLRHPDGVPFAMAGLWDRWRAPDDDASGSPEAPRELWSCSVVVGGSDPWYSRFHHRMPLLLRPELYERWLDPDLVEATRVSALLAEHAFDTASLVAERIGTAVNNPRYDAPEGLAVVAG